MTLVNSLKNICKDAKGTFVSIGLNYPTVESVIEKNKNITNGYMFVFNGKKITKSDKKTLFRGRKKVSIKKLRKAFVKKSVASFLCNYEDIKKYMRYFVKDSVYINNGKLYIYGKIDEYVLDDIKEYYGRYKTSIDIEVYGDSFLVIIDNKLSKNNWLSDKKYFIIDSVRQFINFISDILVG